MGMKLYTRRGCGLCEEAEEMLLAFLAEIEVVDVDADADAVARYGLRVPVLTQDDEVVCEGRFHEPTVVRLFAR